MILSIQSQAGSMAAGLNLGCVRYGLSGHNHAVGYEGEATVDALLQLAVET